MFISNIGNVGINTLIPAYKLHVYAGQTLLDNATAATTTNQSSQLMVANSGGGTVALELWRNANASWQISNEGGILHFRNNYTTAKQTTYVQDSITVDYNTGITTFKGTTDSTAANKGTVIVNGGVGIAKELHVGTRIQIHNTAAAKHLEFTRSGSWNYITFPNAENTVLAIGVDTGDSAVQKLVITRDNVVRPGAANAESLGASDKAWAQIYGNGIHTNVANKNDAGGLSLYGTAPTTYGIAMRTGAAHGWICAATTANLATWTAANGLDWNINFYNSGSVNRGWKFMTGTTTVASISNNGYTTVNRLGLNRKNGAKNGRIYWYESDVASSPYYTWVTYMSDVSNGNAPTGGKPSGLGNVTSWAMRSLIEHSANYGWLLESTTNAVATANTVTPLPQWALSSVNGQMTLTGDIYHATYNAARTSITRTAAAVSFRLGTADGSGMYIGDGALTVIGGGESAQYMADDTNNYRSRIFSSAANTTEELWAMSDSHIRFITNANNLNAASATWTGYTQTPDSSNKFYEVILDNRINFYPWITNYGNLGHSSYYWRGAYINGRGNIHWNNLVKVSPGSDTITTTDTNRGLPRILMNQSDVSMNGRGSKFWGLSPASVTLESTSNSGASWAAHTVYTTDAHKRGVTNGAGTSVTVGNLTYDAGSGKTTKVAVGQGVRITLSFEAEHRFGYIECMVIAFYTRGHTCSFKVERYNKNTTTWTTIEEGTLTNTNQNRVIYPATTWYMNGATSSSAASYANQLRVTMIVTALGTAQRYAPAIHGIYGYGGGNPSHTRNATYPSGRLFDLITAQYGTPYYYSDRNAGTVIIPTYDINIYGVGAYTAANTAVYASVTIGNNGKQADAGAHAEGRLIIYAKGQYYHLLKGHDTIGGGNYTHTLPNASGELVQCRIAGKADTDYQTAILFHQNASSHGYPSNYGTVLVMAYRKASDNAKPDYTNQIFIPTGDTATYGDTMMYRTSIADSWHDWQMVAHAPAKTAVGSGIIPTYINAAGKVTASTSTAGTSKKPIYLNAGTLTACSYELNAGISSGTASHLAYYSAATTIASASNTTYSTNYITQTVAGEAGFQAKNTSGAHQSDFIVGSSGNGGIYDHTNSYWMVYSTAAGRTYIADSYDKKATALAYSQAGLAASAISWLACWNGYELRAISKAEVFNAVRDNGGDGRWVNVTGDTMSGTLTFSNANIGIARVGRSSSWWNQRDLAMVKMTSLSGLSPCISLKSNNGNWTLATYNHSSYTDKLIFSYTADTTYNSSGSTNSSTNICMRATGVVESAMWNDYAEYRKATTIEPGRVVYETGSQMELTNERLLPGAKVVSDTYGFTIGHNDEAQTPIAVSGRVLVYPYRDRNTYPLGAAVCSAPNGTIDIMTREEIMMYPERIIGTVSEIPTYNVWQAGGGDTEIQVNGRIWIYVR